MTSPRLEACYFLDGNRRWERLARVLEWTARQHCPGWRIAVSGLVPKFRPSAHAVRSAQANTQKLEWWAHQVATAADGDRLLLLDADTMILRPLDDVWAEDFEWAYTTKAESFPFNAGVMFLRVSPAVRAVMAEWLAVNLRMLGSSAYHGRFRPRYGGMNQSAFGALLEGGAFNGLRLRTLPCVEWNCEDTGWAHFDPAVTRILHVKSSLRHVCLNGFVVPELAPLAARWRAADAEATRALRRAG